MSTHIGRTYNVVAPGSSTYTFTASVNGLNVQNTDTLARSGLLNVLPSAAGQNVFVQAYGFGTPTASNTEAGVFGWNQSLGSYVVSTGSSGTGTSRPLVIYTGSHTSQLVLNTDGTASFSGTVSAPAIAIGGPITGGYSSPSVTVSASNLVNVASTSSVVLKTSRLYTNGTDRFLTLCLTVAPIAGAANTEFRFSVPDRTTISNDYDIMATVNAWHESDSEQVMNAVVLGNVATNNGRVRFTSVDTGLHTLVVHISYSAN